MDHQPNGGGAANTPPFPRLVRSEPDITSDPDVEQEPPTRGSKVASEIRGPADPFDDEEAPPHQRETRAGSTPPPNARPRRGRPDLRSRAELGLQRGFERIADRLEETAERLEHVAEERLVGPGPRARAGDLAFSAAGWIGEVSDYLRTSELDTVRSDLERQVRERPIQSLLVAAGAGWLLGKILR